MRLYHTLSLMNLASAYVASVFPLIHDASAAMHSDLNAHERALFSVCQGPVAMHYFEVSIRITPGGETGICTVADQVILGNDLNQLLFNFGIGDTGIGSDLFESNSFVAGVCPLPSTSIRRNLIWSPRDFIWTGGGGCRLCLSDNHQRRSLRAVIHGVGTRELQSAQVGDPDWFMNVYAPATELAIESAILQYVVSNHEPCLDLFPSVDVKLEEITLVDLNLDCEDGTIIESLQTLNISEAALKTQDCGTCKSMDFSRTGNNGTLKGGDYVQDEWKMTHGVEVSASGGYTPSFKARIFDTGDTECMTPEGKIDFGTPTKSCSGGKIGEDSGVSKSESGENCESIGNVLIIQDSNKDCPDASSNGGSLKFTWDKPVLVSDIGLMDIDEKNQRLKFTFADGFVETFTYKSFGNNAVQRVVANKKNVVELEVVLTGTGAVTEINFCHACNAANDYVEPIVDRHCISDDNNRVLPRPKTIIAYDDFESSSSLIGWSNGKLDNQEQGEFTTFLGRYAKNTESPFKTYKVPNEAESIIISIDLYKIDGWDFVQDAVQVFIDGDLINLGASMSLVDTGHQEGVTNLGILWRIDSTTPPMHLGYDTSHLDQKFKIEVNVPKNSGLYEDGRLRLTLKTNITTIIDMKSAGWDNIKLVGQFGCEHQEMILESIQACSTMEYFNDFEGSDALSGWTNGRIETGDQPSFTRFLGRYASGDDSPEKTFAVPSTADEIVIEVDFYEIDSWNAWPDAAAIYIDEEKINLGGFHYRENEGHRFGSTRAGLYWQLDSLTDPTELGFGNRNIDLDQKHRVRLVIPKTSGLFDDGELHMKLAVNLDHRVDDESGGWDNISIISSKSCNENLREVAPLPISTGSQTCKETTILIDDFEGDDALSGWINGKVETGGGRTFTNFLGRYSSGDTAPEKTFDVPTTAYGIIFEVDFYEIDSWNAWPDVAAIYIDGEKINLDAFHWRGDEGHRFGTTKAGMYWQLDSLTDPTQLGFGSRNIDFDQKHRVRVEIPKSSELFDDGKLHVKLEVRLSGGLDDKSGGWDNVKIKTVDEACRDSLTKVAPVYVVSAMCNETSIIINDFEGRDALVGWTNGKLEIGEQSAFTKFLGRYSTGDASPEKTFAVPTTADGIIFEVDFYEIDSWNAWPDAAAIYVDGEKINLGGFDSEADEGHRFGTTSAGLYWQLDSLTERDQMGFGDGSFYLDQKHRVRIEIPKTSGLFDDGKLHVKFVVYLNHEVDDESGGWDNINIKLADKACLKILSEIALPITRTPLCPEKTIFVDNFESFGALSGWTDGKLETGEQTSFTKFLGRYASGDASPQKTFAVPSTASKIIVEVDFYEIDNWKASPDAAAIYIDEEKINLGLFHWRGDEGHRFGTTSAGLSWQLDSLTEPTQLGFGSRNIDLDQKHRVRIEIPKRSGLFDDKKLRVKLHVNLSGGLDDESGGWDNLNIKSVNEACLESSNETAPDPTSNPVVTPTCNEETIMINDFEGHDSLTGWSNAKLETGEQSAFTKFLGRYSTGDAAPEKTFAVPTTADEIVFEVDFYEIDSWNAWPDAANIYVDGEKISLGVFDPDEDEGHRFGTTSAGLFWQLDSLTSPAQLGFGNLARDRDQKHRVRIEIPKTSGLFDDGIIHVKLEVILSGGLDDESGGWDNIKIKSVDKACRDISNDGAPGLPPSPTPGPPADPTPVPSVTPTCSSKTIMTHDFEGQDALSGWTNAKLETGEQSVFTKFLGRYSTGDASPEKAFAVPTTADEIIFEVDFYEIDSWNAGRDTAAIYFDGEKINLGDFDSEADEGHRFGTTSAGLFWQLDSLIEPTQLGFGSRNIDLDQKHRVRIEIPKSSGLFNDGKLHVKLEVRLSGGLDDESGGWDNIQIKSVDKACRDISNDRAPDPPVDPTPVPSVTPTCSNKIIVMNDFEGQDALSGWTNAKLETGEQSTFTKFLGRYSTGDASPQKTFVVLTTADRIIFEVDFYEIDSWNAGRDTAAIYIDGEKINLGDFDSEADEGKRSGTTRAGLYWQLDSLIEPTQLGFGSRNIDLDQKHRVRIEIPKTSGLFDDGKLHMKLEVRLSGGLDDESGGWDNIKMLSRRFCSI